MQSVTMKRIRRRQEWMTPAEDAAPDDSDSEEEKWRKVVTMIRQKKNVRRRFRELRPVLLSRGHSTV